MNITNERFHFNFNAKLVVLNFDNRRPDYVYFNLSALLFNYESA